ncbi:MAG: FAD-dependent oxidoreductase [Anaerolineales bacterium]|nr:FAD-dependent oxidoreductase [Anaerolineales bacterium]
MSVGRHPNIKLLTCSEVESVSGYVGNFTVNVRRQARYIDESICAGCGLCASVCPVDVINEFDQGLSKRRAAYRVSAQAVPGAYAIDKHGVAPCRAACPTDQRAMGYVALVQKKRYADAYWAIRREHPFPSVCGRVCNRNCEAACSRGKVDEPVNIMGIKRFVADWAYEHRHELPNMRDKSMVGTPFQHNPPPTGKKVAVIGAGPAGLTAALDLVRLGHGVKVFDALPKPGGMIRVGIPPHRLPYEMLDWEIQQVLDEGVELQLNTWVDDIPAMLKWKGPHGGPYDAVLVATGAHVAKKVNIPNNEHPDNWLSLDFLKQVCLGESPDLTGKQVAVIGGGNVALDCARSAVRLGASGCRMIFRKPKGEMTGFEWEVAVAEEEGVEMCGATLFKEVVVEHGDISGVRCVRTEYHGYDASGRIVIFELPGSEHVIPADIVIWATGQGCDLSFLPEDGSIQPASQGIESDGEMMTSLAGVFVAGDVHRGSTFYVVDAIGEGHHAARAIDRYLRGEEGIPEPDLPPVVELDVDEVRRRIVRGEASERARIPIRTIPLEDRKLNFREVDLTLTEEEAVAEAERCVRCGTCAECLECVAVCDRGAINHEMHARTEELTVGTIVLATGFREFNPSRAPELNYGKLPNILTALEFERLLNASGPTLGSVTLQNGQVPKSVAIVHCVGSRDAKYNEYCSRACCMYSLKLSQLAHEYLGAEVHEIYRDMRSFGKGYEEFFNRTTRMGVHFYHGRVKAITRKSGKLRVSWTEAFHNQPDHVDVEMVVLATGFEPREDAGWVASIFGINRSQDGFFRERHPKLAPVETASEGIYVAGACQSPKDIPDSVTQAGSAAAVALSLMDQGTIALDPAIATVNEAHCAGCGQCVTACPYGAISLVDARAQVNAYACKGCGTCAATCPNKAMTLIHYNDRQIVAEIIGALAVENPEAL